MKNNSSIFTIISIFLFLNAASAQEKSNQLNAKGKKEGVWKGVFDESKRPRYEGTFKDGVEVGTFKYFDDTKAQSLIGTRVFSKNGTVAETTFFDQKGNKVSEGTTVNRINEGVWNYYHKGSKQLMTVENYKKGKLDGIRIVYFPSGALVEQGNYLKGLKEGIHKIYLENGVVSEESTFVNNQLHGVTLFRDIKGELISKGNFVKNEKKGIWEFYEDGKLIKKEKYPVRLKFQKRKNVPEE